MAEWLSIIGIGEDGLNGLTEPALQALSRAEIIFGGARHLKMVTHDDLRPWPVPFDLAPLLACRGRRVVALTSGDPFWFGAGGSLASHLAADEWRAYPQVSIFSLMAAQLGWRLENIPCLGLHARPFDLLRPRLAPLARLMVTLRDGSSPQELAEYLTRTGFGDSQIHLFQRLGGEQQKISRHLAKDGVLGDISDPVAAAIEVMGDGAVLPLASGRDDSFFDHDGQITKRPIRALALSALAPRQGELLWDIGAGSGSIGIEWMLSHPRNRTIAIEQNPDRAARASRNAQLLGVEGYQIHCASAFDAIATLPPPAAVFIGGGADQALLEALWTVLPAGCRLVAHAVTLESMALFTEWQAQKGGNLLRIELSSDSPLGSKRGWKAAYPVVQWSVTR